VEICDAKVSNTAWVIDFDVMRYLAPDLSRLPRRARIAGKTLLQRSVVKLDVNPLHGRYVLKACQQNQPCETYTAPPDQT
jgi:hypothetical protein